MTSPENRRLRADVTNYVARAEFDVKRFDEILAQDFYCSNPDKSLSTARLPEADRDAGAIKNLRADVKIRILGDLPSSMPHQLHDADGSMAHRLLGEADGVASSIGHVAVLVPASDMQRSLATAANDRLDAGDA